MARRSGDAGPGCLLDGNPSSHWAGSKIEKKCVRFFLPDDSREIGVMSHDPERDSRQGESEEFMNRIARVMSQARAGDRAAIDDLFAQFRGYLLLIANEELGRDLQGKFGASDFVQETLLIAHRKFEQFQGQTAEEFKGWLRQILRNDLQRIRRKYSGTQKRNHRREHRLDGSVQITNPTDPHPTPQAKAIVREEAKLLEIAMSKLPPHYRTAVKLREWEDQSYAEVGQQMGTTEEAARKLCSRAMAKLEEILKQVMDESKRLELGDNLRS